MRKQAEFDRDNGRLNTLVDNHCLLDLLDVLAAVQALPPTAERPAVRDLIAHWRELAAKLERQADGNAGTEFCERLHWRIEQLRRCADALETACAEEGAAVEAARPQDVNIELLSVLKAIVAVLQQEAPGTPLNNHKYDALGIQAHAAIANAEREKCAVAASVPREGNSK